MVKSPDPKMSGKKEIEDSPIQRFCKKCNINYNLIMLKITLFLMYGGKSSSMKYTYKLHVSLY